MYFDKDYFDKIKIYSITLFPFSLLLGPAILNLYVSILIILSIIIFRFDHFLKFKYIFLSSLALSIYLIIVANFKYIDQNSFIKSLLFIRYPLLAIVVGFFFYKYAILKKYVKILIFIFIFLFFDSTIQFFFEKNIFMQQPLTTGEVYRITSVFGKESILGSYILKIIYPAIIIYVLKYNKNNFLFILFFVLSLILIIMSGERIILLKFLLFNSLLLFCLKKYKYVFYSFFLSFLLIISFFYTSDYFYDRVTTFYYAIINITKTPYFPLFEKAYIIFKDNILTGVGFKNFRHACNFEQYTLTISYLVDAGCSTHPHNYILEILSESGIVGLLLFFNIFIYVIIRSFKNNKKVDYLTFLLLFFILLWPLGTNSSFFSTFNGYIIWFNIGILLSYTKLNENINSY